jgi:hypothetical protein
MSATSIARSRPTADTCWPSGGARRELQRQPLLLPVRRLSDARAIPPRLRAFEIINDCTVAFFDELVKGEGQPFPDTLLSRQPELLPCRSEPPVGAVLAMIGRGDTRSENKKNNKLE